MTSFQNNTFEAQLQDLFSNLALKLGYHDKIFTLEKNFSKKGKNAGNLISTSVQINEESYPYDINKKIAKSTSVLLIYPNNDMHELRISIDMYNEVRRPSAAHIKKEAASQDKYINILFNFNDNSIFDYISNLLEYALNHYASSNTFGCCSRYEQCSASKQCIHPNKLYAKGCQYRNNLENGKIFYKG